MSPQSISYTSSIVCIFKHPGDYSQSHLLRVDVWEWKKKYEFLPANLSSVFPDTDSCYPTHWTNPSYGISVVTTLPNYIFNINRSKTKKMFKGLIRNLGTWPWYWKYWPGVQYRMCNLENLWEWKSSIIPAFRERTLWVSVWEHRGQITR